MTGATINDVRSATISPIIGGMENYEVRK